MNSTLRNSLIGGGTFLSGVATGIFIRSTFRKNQYQFCRRVSNKTLRMVKQLSDSSLIRLQSPLPQLFKEDDTFDLHSEELRNV